MGEKAERQGRNSLTEESITIKASETVNISGAIASKKTFNNNLMNVLDRL